MRTVMRIHLRVLLFVACAAVGRVGQAQEIAVQIDSARPFTS